MDRWSVEILRDHPEVILCIDCSYGKGRHYYHAPPECAGAEYPEELPQPEFTEKVENAD